MSENQQYRVVDRYAIKYVVALVHEPRLIVDHLKDAVHLKVQKHVGMKLESSTALSVLKRWFHLIKRLIKITKLTDMPDINYYYALGIQRGASPADIRAAWKNQC